MNKTFTLIFSVICYLSALSVNAVALEANVISGDLAITNFSTGQTITLNQLKSQNNDGVVIVNLFSYECVPCKSAVPELVTLANENPAINLWTVITSPAQESRSKVGGSDWFTDLENSTGTDVASKSSKNINWTVDNKLGVTGQNSQWNTYYINSTAPTHLVIRLSDLEILYKGNDKNVASSLALQTLRTNDALVAIEKELTQNRFSTYPNPTSGTLNFLLAEKNDHAIYIEVYNVLGGKVKSTYAPFGEKEFKIELNDLESGLYVVKYIDGDYRRSIKITLRR